MSRFGGPAEAAGGADHGGSGCRIPVADSDAAAPGSKAATDESAWPDEPRTAEDLELKYDRVVATPGRSATTELRIVRATPKDGSEPTGIESDQQYKLFIVPALVIENILDKVTQCHVSAL